MSYKAILPLYIVQNLDIDYVNVKTTFFYKLIEEIIYVSQLISYCNKSALIYKF